MPSTRQQNEGGEDAIQLLTQDHDEVRRMFEEFESADEDRKFELAAEACQALTVHAAIEEEIFYPQLREAIDAEDLLLEAEIEHDTVKQLIERIQAGEVDELQLTAMIRVLKEYVNHHVNEETRKIFPRARRSGLDLAAMGRELQQRRDELEAELASAMSDDVDESGDAGEEREGPGGTRGGMAARDGTSGDR